MGAHPGGSRPRCRLALVVLVAMVAAACGDDTDPAGISGAADATSTTAAVERNPEPTPPPAPRQGGILTHGLFAESAGLDPVVVPGAGAAGGAELAAVYDVLVRYDPERAEYEGRIAESLVPDEDFTEWTLRLREGVTFSDGTPYDAEAVVFAMERHTRFGSGAAGLVANIADYVVVDATTVVFRLAGPWSGFPYVLASTPGMVPSPTAVRAACGLEHEVHPRDCEFNLRPVGAGPFVVESYRPGDAINLVRNDGYWAGEVHLDGLRFVALPSGDQTYEALKRGTLESGFLRDTEVIARARTEGALGGYALSMQWLGGVLVLNNGEVHCAGGQPAPVCDGRGDGAVLLDTPTADRRVRQAIAMAIDPEVLDQRRSGGTGFPGRELFGPHSRWASSAPTSRGDPDQARALVAEVKAESGWDGTLRLRCHNDPAVLGLAIAVQAMLADVGFRPVLKNDYDIGGLVLDVLIHKQFDVACWGLNVADEAPEVAFQLVLTSDSPGNAMNLRNPEIDALVRQLREAADDDERWQVLEDIQEIWRHEQPAVVWSSMPEAVVWAPRVHGVEMTVASIALFHRAWLA